jgi:hypothetical protein
MVVWAVYEDECDENASSSESETSYMTDPDSVMIGYDGFRQASRLLLERERLLAERSRLLERNELMELENQKRDGIIFKMSNRVV